MQRWLPRPLGPPADCTERSGRPSVAIGKRSTGLYGSREKRSKLGDDEAGCSASAWRRELTCVLFSPHAGYSGCFVRPTLALSEACADVFSLAAAVGVVFLFFGPSGWAFENSTMNKVCHSSSFEKNQPTIQAQASSEDTSIIFLRKNEEVTDGTYQQQFYSMRPRT